MSEGSRCRLPVSVLVPNAAPGAALPAHLVVPALCRPMGPFALCCCAARLLGPPGGFSPSQPPMCPHCDQKGRAGQGRVGPWVRCGAVGALWGRDPAMPMERRPLSAVVVGPTRGRVGLRRLEVGALSSAGGGWCGWELLEHLQGCPGMGCGAVGPGAVGLWVEELWVEELHTELRVQKLWGCGSRSCTQLWVLGSQCCSELWGCGSGAVHSCGSGAALCPTPLPSPPRAEPPPLRSPPT